MYTADRNITSAGPGDPGLSMQFMSSQLIDGGACGRTATPREFDEGLRTRCAPRSAPMVGVCAQRRATGRDVVFGLEHPLVDEPALEDEPTQ